MFGFGALPAGTTQDPGCPTGYAREIDADSGQDYCVDAAGVRAPYTAPAPKQAGMTSNPLFWAAIVGGGLLAASYFMQQQKGGKKKHRSNRSRSKYRRGIRLLGRHIDDQNKRILHIADELQWAAALAAQQGRKSDAKEARKLAKMMRDKYAKGFR